MNNPKGNENEGVEPPPAKRQKQEESKQFEMEDQSEMLSDISGLAEKAGAGIQIDMNELKDLEEQDKQKGTNDKKNKRVKKWEKRWILVPNVFQFGQDVWVHKWVNDQQILESNELLKKKQDTSDDIKMKSPSRVAENKVQT